MDTEKSPSPSPSPSPRGFPSIDNTSFTSPPFMSTLPLPRSLTRPTSDSNLRGRKRALRARKGHGKSLQPDLRTRSAASSIGSHSSSSSSNNDRLDNNGSFNLGDYTIDLANLGQSSAGGRDLFAAMGGSEIETPTRAREIVGSEDDGPEDFTINMGKWMKGIGELYEMRTDIEEGKDEDEADKSPITEHIENKSQSERRASVENLSEVEDLEGSIIVNTPTRLAESKETTSHDRSNTTSSTPLDPQRPSAMQQGTPNTKISALEIAFENLRLEADSYRREVNVLDEERAQLETEREDLASELRAVKLSLEQSESTSRNYQKRWEQEVDKQSTNSSIISSLRAKIEPLAQEVQTAQTKADEIQDHSGRKIKHLTETLEAAQTRLRSVNQLKANALADASELVSLRSELAQCKQSLQDQDRKTQAQEETFKLHTEDFQARLTAGEKASSNVTILERELEHAQEQLTETRRILDTVENENDRFIQETERRTTEAEELKKELIDARGLTQARHELIDEHTVTRRKLEGEIEQLRLDLRESEARKDSEDLLDAVNRSAEKIDTAEADMRLADQLDSLSTHYEAEIEALKTAHAQEMKKLKSTILRAGDGMRKREARMTGEHAAEVKSLKQTIASLEQEQAETTPTAQASQPKRRERSSSQSSSSESGQVTELRSAIRVFNNKLATALDELKKSREEVRGLRAQAKQQTRELQEQETGKDPEAAIRALEERFAQASEKREKEWRRRIGIVLRERDMMGKALMLNWGKEEVGGREREVEGKGADGIKVLEKGMGYRYQFVKR